MRVISGVLAGRTFESPHGYRTHPMSEKIRGAIFNMLGDIEGLTVLDAFAGSGAIAIEALSRGAASALAIDVDKGAVRTIQENAAALDIGMDLKVIRANAGGWSENNPDQQFDLVVCDPPYDDVQLNLLEKLSKHAKPGGLYICSVPPNTQIKLKTEYSQLAIKNYGDATLVFYRRTS